jgi:hypothetical protein
MSTDYSPLDPTSILDRASFAELKERVTLDLALDMFGSALPERTNTDGWKRGLLTGRISKDDVDGTNSVPRQLQRLIETCIEHHILPVALCAEFESAYRLRMDRTKDRFDADGRNLSSRKLWWRYYDLIKTGQLKIDCVVTYHPDRFTRNTFNGAEWLQMLRAHGIMLIAVGRPPRLLEDFDELRWWEGKFQKASESSDDTSRRIHDNFAVKVKARRLLSGKIGYGHLPKYDTTRRSRSTGGPVIVGMVADPAAKPFFDRARQLVIEDGRSIYQVVETLNRERLAKPGCAEWSIKTLRDVLEALRLVGKARWKGEVVELDIERIYSDEDFAAICDAIATRHGRVIGDYTLSGKGVCGICGKSIVGSAQTQRGVRLYKCNHKTGE